MRPENFQGSWVSASGADALAKVLANDVANWLREGIKQNGKASLVVSGGSTPAPFFKALSSEELAWSNVTVTLADERWVPVTDKLSNEKMIRESFLINAATAASFVSVYNGAATPEEGWEKCERSLRAVSTPSDVVILGMGGDGHTASLFPATENLSQACDLSTDKLCWPMHPPHLPEARMTLTLAALINCRQLVLHMTGDDKLNVFSQAVGGTDYPIASVVDAAKDRLQVYWSA